MQQAPSRANRIPRCPQRTPSGLARLCRRLHTAVRRIVLELQLAHTDSERRRLIHDMALDRAAAAVHHVTFTSCPKLQLRLYEDQLRLQSINELQLRRTVALAQLELQR